MKVKTFLLVDDDHDDAEIFCETLVEIDASILCYCAFNGSEALQKLTNNEIPQPDIIFMDINMPLMNGWLCLEKLKSDVTYKDIPVVMYTTSSNPKDISIAAEMGAAFFFTKAIEHKKMKTFLETVVLNMDQGSFQSIMIPPSSSC